MIDSLRFKVFIDEETKSVVMQKSIEKKRSNQDLAT